MNTKEFLAHFKAEFLKEFEKQVEILRKQLNISLQELDNLYATWVELQESLPQNHEFSSTEMFEMLLVKHNKKAIDFQKKQSENEAGSHSL